MIHFYWDLDDTLLFTHNQFTAMLIGRFGLSLPKGTYYTTENTKGLIDKIMDPGHFMSITPIDSAALYQMTIMRRLLAATSHGMCTHRGYHKEAAALTQPLFDEHNIQFDSVHYLDPAVHPDKMKYLRALHHPDDIVVLVDDNTHYPHDLYPNTFTVLIDQPWNQHVVPLHPELRITSHQLLDTVLWLLERYDLTEVATHGRGTKELQIINKYGSEFSNERATLV